MENYINFTLTPEERTTIYAGIDMIDEVLKDRLIALTNHERQRMLKLSDKGLAFVEKSIRYAENHPELAPNYLDLQSLKIDFEAYSELRLMKQKLMGIISAMDDTAMLSGKETYKAALSFYNSVKDAYRNNVPGAAAIYDDLKNNFNS